MSKKVIRDARLRDESLLNEIPSMSYQERRLEGLKARFAFSIPKTTPPVIQMDDSKLEDLPTAEESLMTDDVVLEGRDRSASDDCLVYTKIKNRRAHLAN